MKSKSFHDVRLVKLKELWKTCRSADREISRFFCILMLRSNMMLQHGNRKNIKIKMLNYKRLYKKLK